MANLRTIQFLRSNTVYESLEAAKTALSSQVATLADGSPIIGRYTSGGTELSVIGIVHKNATATGITFFESANDVADKLAQLQLELDTAEAAVGLASGGTKVTQEGEFISGETTIEGEIKALNDALEAVNNTVDNMEFGPLGGGAAEVINWVDQVDGVLSATTKNVGNLVLTGYDKGSDSGAIIATDSINAAFSKVENQIDAVNGVINNLDASSVSGDSKVVIDVTQEDGKITATAANLTGVKLDGYTEGTDADIAATDTLGVALGKLQAQINAMDKAASAVAGQVVTTVTEDDGKVTETKANVKDLQLGGYVKDTTATGAISGTDTVNAALSKLENQIGSNTVTNADGSITVTTTGNTTDVAVHIKSGEKVIKLDANGDGIYTNLNLVKITESLPAEIKERYELRDSDNVKIGNSIDVPKDSHIVSINYITTGEHAQNLEYVYLDVSGNTQTTYVDMSSLVIEAEFASGVTAIDHVVRGVIDPTSESFLTVGADGFKVSGVQNAIDTAISGLDFTTDAAVDGQYVAAIEETDGVVAVKTRANVSEAVLNNYAKGSDATAVSATDTVNQAISKLENQIDTAKAAATTKVVEGADAGNNLEIASATSADGSVTYTVNLTDVASASALTAEIAARKAVDGQNGSAYTANSSANYIAAATDLNDADVKLDAALKQLSGKTFTEAGSANNSITFVESVAADGTTHIDAQTDASKISGLTAVADVADEISGVSTTDSVQTGIENLYASLAAEIAARKAAISSTTVNGSNAIDVTRDATSGDTVSLKLDATTNGNGHEKTGNDNALTITNDGLFLSTNWDCGTFNDSNS